MPVDPNCLPADAVPIQQMVDGRQLPMTGEGAGTTEQVLLERLATRRDELSTYEQELALRESLVAAAEQRIEERSQALQALETQIATLVDQRAAIENEQFASVVSMYETMKPKEAAVIFNTLDMSVLERVAKTMNPRKMAPILAEMTPERAQELTIALSSVVTDPPEQMKPDDLAALPQIVGQ